MLRGKREREKNNNLIRQFKCCRAHTASTDRVTAQISLLHVSHSVCTIAKLQQEGAKPRTPAAAVLPEANADLNSIPRSGASQEGRARGEIHL